jgi:2-keto-4-pentenoate hydratase/2-oxohepta-3-ene-1,7-dioic acid hydratase in catechol pathway
LVNRGAAQVRGVGATMEPDERPDFGGKVRLGSNLSGQALLISDDELFELRALDGQPLGMIEAITNEFEAPGTLVELAEHAAGRSLDSVALGAPIPLPGAVIAAPINYRDHMVEMSDVRDIRYLGMFLKARSSVTGPGSVVRLPYTDRRFDHEGELGVVIGKVTDNVSEAEALSSVFGYTCLLDITMRGGEDRSTRKSFRTFTPIGPYLVTADEVGDPTDLRIVCNVNGTERQSETTKEMVWSVAELIAYTSSVMTLYPGDIIASGTPAGIGPIFDGDVIDVIIERVGHLHVSVSEEGAVSCPTLGAGAGPTPPPPPAR